MTILGSGEERNIVDGVFLVGDNVDAVCGAVLLADAAAVAHGGVDNGLFPLLLGDELAGLTLVIENALVLADMAASAAVDAAVGVDLVHLLHLAGDRSYGTDLCAVVAALAFIGINHVILHSLADIRAAFLFLNVFYIFFREILDRS